MEPKEKDNRLSEGEVLSTHLHKNRNNSLQSIIGDIKDELAAATAVSPGSGAGLGGTAIGQANPFDEFSDQAEAAAAVPRRDEQMEEVLGETHDRQPSGVVVEGVIVDIIGHDLLIDIGDKAEGRMSIDELKITRELGQFHKGDKIAVLIERRRSDGAEPVLSRAKAKQIIAAGQIRKAFEEKQPIEGVVDEIVAEGCTVDLGGVKGFCHRSQFTLTGKIDLKTVLHKKLSFYIGECDLRRNKLSLSHRAYLDRSRQQAITEFCDRYKEGDVIDGTVKNITNFGIFVELNQFFDGLIQRNDISWKSNTEKEMKSYTPGRKITTKIIGIDRDNGKIRLGLKQLTPDPWLQVKEKYPVQALVKGTVLNLADFGAFVELEPGVEGLIHVSDLSWSKKNVKVRDLLREHETVEVRVIDIKEADRRIALSLKHVSIDPWQLAARNHPVGSAVDGTITGIANFGLFVEIDDGIEGLVPLEEIDWTDSSRQALKQYKVGQAVNVMVLAVSTEDKRIKLGLRQLKEDPYTILIRNHPEGSVIDGTVARIIPQGVFVSVGHGIDGFIPAHHVSEDKDSTAIKELKPGQALKTRVIRINPAERKITLSLKDYQKVQEQQELSQYMKSPSGGFSLGDIMKDKLSGIVIRKE